MRDDDAPTPSSPGIGRAVSIRNLTNVYGNVRAVDGISIDIEAGEFVSILGPSGSGKTTTMMSIAGFAGDYSGTISIGDSPIDHLPPHRRDVGVVFQDLALFPHMTVFDNVAFPLRMRGAKRDVIKTAVMRVLNLVHLSQLAERLPAQLSGGQRQRVALARALVFDPPVLLLDEPFGALDRKLRENLHIEIKALHRRLGTTIILITHDQGEAISMSDRVAVMNQGRIEQFASPQELYRSPANRFVAEFVGESSFLLGEVTDEEEGCWVIKTDGGLTVCAGKADRASFKPGARVALMLRPECFALGSTAGDPDKTNAETGVVTDITYLGDRVRYTLALNDSEAVAAIIAQRETDRGLELGSKTKLTWRYSDTGIFTE